MRLESIRCTCPARRMQTWKGCPRRCKAHRSTRTLRASAESALVLETDAPDIAPQWMHLESGRRRNEPAQLPRIGAVIAQLRAISPEQLADITRRNVLAAIPRLASVETRLCS